MKRSYSSRAASCRRNRFKASWKPPALKASCEALRKTHGLTIDGLGRVEILVSSADEERARELLASAERGAFRLDDDAEV